MSKARSLSPSRRGPAPAMVPARSAAYAPPRFRLPRRYVYLLFALLAFVFLLAYKRRTPALAAVPGQGSLGVSSDAGFVDNGGLSAGHGRAGALVDAVDHIAEHVLPDLRSSSRRKSFEDYFVDLDDEIETLHVGGVPGYQLFTNLYAFEGVLYAVTPTPSTFVDVSRILSHDAHGPAHDDEWQVITPSQARTLFGGGRIARLTGDTMLFADGPPTSYIDHYYHFLVECVSGAWRVLAHTDDESDPLPGPPERVIFSRAPRWRDGPGLNSWFLQTVLPGTHVEDKDGWRDRAVSGRVYRFDRVVVVDRWASHRHNPTANHWNKMNADVYDAVSAPDDWWAPVRSALMHALEIPDVPIAEKPVVTYVNRQGTSKRRISDATHESLMNALYDIEEEGLAQVYDAKMEQIPKREQFGLSSRTDILLGVHGNGLSHLMWLPRGSHVIEIFAPEGFTRDYQILTKHLGHHHYAVWNDRVYLESEWQHAAPNLETAIDFQGTEIPIDGAFIKALIQDIVENDGVNYRSA